MPVADKPRSSLAAMAALECIAAFTVIAACSAWIGWESLSRRFLQANTESDFPDPFWPEARRFLAGEPMLVQFHPPGYPMLLAGVYRLVGDAMHSALVISWTAAVIALAASWLLYRRAGGSLAGMGALMALAASMPFYLLGAMATSDVFFFAIWTVALLMASYALDSGKSLHWLLTGVLASCVILCRTNGIVIGMLVVAPFLTAAPFRTSARNALWMLVGLVAPIALWAVYAARVGSPVMPTKNFANLALTYFSTGGRISGEAMTGIERQFGSLWDVLIYDPATILRVYARDMLALPKRLLTEITWWPISVTGVLGILWWLRRWRDPQLLLLLLPAIAAVFFLNLKAYEPRYFLFIAPLLGGATGYALRGLAERAGSPPFHLRVGIASLAGFGLAALAVIGPKALARVEDPLLDAQLAEAVPAAAIQVPRDGVIVARRENLAFHAERASVVLPEAQTPAELCQFLEGLAIYPERFVFAGMAERRQRADIAAWLVKDPLPAWLEVVAESASGGSWRLVKLAGNADCESADTRAFPSANGS